MILKKGDVTYNLTDKEQISVFKQAGFEEVKEKPKKKPKEESEK